MDALISLLILLVIAGICGVIAEWIVGFSPGGFVVSVIVGLLGAYLGSWLAQRIGLPSVLNVLALLPGTTPVLQFDVVWAILGSILLLLVISLVRGTGRAGGRRRRGRYF
jgi:uncharacterized membrane protein YeaQ/YmgE (transglycosylase-associated protein family)